MKNRLNLLLIILLYTGLPLKTIQATSVAGYRYQNVAVPWNEALGNHRAVIQVKQPADVVGLSYQWRRSDADVANRCLLIVNAQTGDTIRNIERKKVNDELCELVFGPVEKAGTYYFYYLPYKVQRNYGYYSRGYYPKEKAEESVWLDKTRKNSNIPMAKVVSVDSRSKFDSFLPMGVIALEKEEQEYIAKYKQSFFAFSEDRANPIRMRKKIPAKWITKKQGQLFKGTALRNEYYTFQIGIWSPLASIPSIQYKATSLISGKNTINSKAITCFNLEGNDPYGNAFKKDIGVAKGRVQPLWMGIDIPANQPAGKYTGQVTVSTGKGDKLTVPIEITVLKEQLADRGDSEPWRHSRLRWLNSSLGLEHTPTKGYTPLRLSDNVVSCLGRDIEINQYSALPTRINSWNNEILSAPVTFVIETAEGIKNVSGTFSNDMIIESGRITGKLEAEDADLRIEIKAMIEFDGWINYSYNLQPKKDIQIRDIRLELPLKTKEAPLFMGMGLPGQNTPVKYQGKWDSPIKTNNSYGVSIPTSKQESWLWPFDSFWIGSAKAGIHCELRGSSYSGPLLSLYRPEFPKSWYNNGKGGFTLEKDSLTTKAVVYSGPRELLANNSITFEFALLITPVKLLDTQSQFRDRYYHNVGKPVPRDDDVKAGVKIINVHHANEYNPYINYPFLTVNKLSKFVSDWHKKGCKVKLYYTLRELTNATTEIWALRSLDHEILDGGSGGGFPWCREHFVTDYTPQWYQHLGELTDQGITADASILTATGDSRWFNYYMEGLAWMVKNMDIDGIYLDDVSFDRRILQRMRRTMDNVKPGCIIDLHSNTGFSKGPANQYAEFFPYVDKLWFGESFVYDKMTPENWLLESSGIPFGLTGDMLHAGGNKWLGMQYGMTVRHPWKTEGVVCDPRPVWKLWDEFNIADAKMVGFWEKDVPVSTTSTEVNATVFINNDRVLVSLGNYSDQVQKVRLLIDTNKLKGPARFNSMHQPQIPDFQKEQVYNLTDEITIDPRRGLLIYLK